MSTRTSFNASAHHSLCRLCFVLALSSCSARAADIANELDGKVTVRIELAELKSKRGDAGDVTETGKADQQIMVGALVVGTIAAATSDGDAPATPRPDGGARFRVGQKVKNPSFLVLWKGTVVRVGGDGSYIIRMDYVANLSGRSPYREKSEYSFVEGEFKEAGGASVLEVIGK